MLVTGGQPYYTSGLLAFLLAAGCVVVVRWASGHAGRWTWLLVGLGVSEAVAVVVALPVIPLSALGSTPIPAINQAARDTVGWPEYVKQVADAVAALPASDASRTVLLTGNYGEAGALDRYGPRYRLPHVYSGQNELFNYGPPPDSARVVVAVGIDLSFLRPLFDNCAQVSTLDNGVGVDNEEQGNLVVVCRDPVRSWRSLWPGFQHYD